MKANELRIGNWAINPFGDFAQVNTIVLNNIIDGVRWKPIPLTEEILLKCGFKKIGYGSLFFNSEFYIRWIDGIGAYDIEMEKGKIHLNYDLKHLHELQNLYFALMGEELKIEL